MSGDRLDKKGDSPMRVAFFGMAVLAVVLAWSIPATAHHSNPLYFDMSKAITLEGEISRLDWINPHILLYLQSKNDKGELETWIIQGSSLNNAVRQIGSMKERLKPGTRISARVWPPRNPLYVNDAQTVLLTKPEDVRTSSRIVGGGQIRFSNGDVLPIGGGPTF
jgi:hypothetical protein